MDTFSVRLNCVDFYQALPTSFDPPLFGKHGSTPQKNAPQLPVIRVFGATETGQKVCAHIHGALPYLYIEYRGSLNKEHVDAYIQKLRASIDHALAISYRRNLYDGKAVFVGHISLVKAVPFFGYHVGYRNYLKVYLLNPLNMTRFADLLHEGAIMGGVIQPFESHLQYLLQWMCDFNLYGCAYINCRQVSFRHPVPDPATLSQNKHKWHSGSIKERYMSDPDLFPRQSHCSIEVDICVSDILNRNEIQERNIHADFIERFKPGAPDEKLVHSLAGLWRDETVRRKRRMGLTDPSSSPFPPEVLISMSADSRDTKDGDWIHEAEFREIIKKLIHEELAGSDKANVDFDSFVKPVEGQEKVQTALESVCDLFHENLQSNSFSSSNETNVDANNGRTTQHSGLENLSALPGFDESDYPYEHVANGRPGGQSSSQSLTPVQDDEIVRAANGAADTAVGPHDGFVDEGFDELEDEQPRKKRRLSQELGDEIRAQQQQMHKQTKRPRVMFSDPPATSHNSRTIGYDTGKVHIEDDNNPGSSQNLSQTSIKANGSQDDAMMKGFKVTKNIAPSQKLSQKTPGKADLSGPTMGNAPISKDESPARSSQSTKTTPVKFDGSSPIKSMVPTPQTVMCASHLRADFAVADSTIVRCYAVAPPSAKMVEITMLDSGRPPVIYQDAFYSNEKDVPERARDYAGREFKLEGTTTPFLPDFDARGESAASMGTRVPLTVDKSKEELMHKLRWYRCTLKNWDFELKAPTRREVDDWLKSSDSGDAKVDEFANAADPDTEERKPQHGPSQIDGPTQKHKHGFKYTQKQKTTSVRHETQYMSIMSLEVHVNSRDSLVPDPEVDEVGCIFWCLKADDSEITANLLGKRAGVLVLSEADELLSNVSRETGVEIERHDTELELINRLVDIVRDVDPDILTGYEVHNGSWGYLIERARLKFEYNLCDELSRTKSDSHGRFGKDADRWGFNHTSTIKVTGRHMINIWRAMRSELNLLQYTMENVVFHVLHKRIPHFSFKDLTVWYKSGKPADLAKCLSYFLTRVQLNLDILDANELIPRTSEQARLIGVDFFSVFSRGSQFKVESFMFRIAKPENFMLVSPSRKQVGQQNALECLPLVMEPQSDFYNSPLLVLDFQSLYPSIMIAYNLCYSTCLGRIVSWRGTNKLGFADFKRQPRLLELVKDYVNIAPNGIMYVKPEMRKSLLAKMLGEILETRVMVKSGMKVDKDDKTLQQLLNNRQLALKLLANVTYGYTSASFSGRMPASEIADSIVQTARETLEKSIAFIHSVEKWGAEVVYGDTDSLFIYLKGRSKDEAFRIGNEIAKEVTNRNPRPIKLKFEKVYFPCVLLAKKRYVGFKYESPNQTEPEFDAKGIETVRRDGTPAEQKIEEKALKILFRTADLSQVKSYFQRQCMKIMQGRVSIQDFCFAREVKLGTYADKGPPPPGALISTRRMLEDHRTEPQYGERVPYVVKSGAPGARLIDRCVAPEELLREDEGQLDAEYYISKNLIPPLERIFNLVGANVRQWYDDMPKLVRIRELNAPVTVPHLQGNDNDGIGARKTLENYLKSSMCVVCRAKMPPSDADVITLPLCEDCVADPAASLYALRDRLRSSQSRRAAISMVCRSCSAIAAKDEVRCDSKDCPVFYSRVKVDAKAKREQVMIESVSSELEILGDQEW